MNGTNYEVPHCGASGPHSDPSWAQIFSSGSCFQITLALNVRDHVSQPYSTTDNVIEFTTGLNLYILEAVRRFMETQCIKTRCGDRFCQLHEMESGL